MIKKLKYFLAIITTMAIILTGCGTNQGSQTETITGTVTTTTTTTIDSSIPTSSSTSQVVVDREFKASDLDVGYEDSTATHITFDGSSIDVSGDGAIAKDSVLTINDEGTYVISGTLKYGQIIVDAEDTDKVQIVLNGITITCPDNAPIYIKNADKTLITLEKGTVNTLIDGAEYVQTNDNNVDGVIYSTADLTINGDGTLNIAGNYKHGIASKDDLLITGGTFNITAVKDALNGKDCVKIKDGTFILSAETGNGIQSKNGDDATKGYVYISGGEITVIKSQEGIEGTVIIIENGTINITAEDDGFNASVGSSDAAEIATEETNITGNQKPEDIVFGEIVPVPGETVPVPGEKVPGEKVPGERVPGEQGKGGFGGGGGNSFEVSANCYISIEGGTIVIDASGDGIDSNGNLYVSGGNTYVSGPTNSGNGGLDYNGVANITGGTVIVTGSTGMAQGFSDTSTQYSLLNNLTTNSDAGTEIKLTDKDGNVLVSYIPKKQYQSIVISTPDLTKEETYTLTFGDQNTEITLTSVVTSNGQQAGMGGPGKR
ncbi:MAG: hypothetical protein K0R15_290 [Clostridiales bacterium]|jgi:hypothetical protein|nr:hypothetical protein [Clostridiales bacterium]